MANGSCFVAVGDREFDKMKGNENFSKFPSWYMLKHFYFNISGYNAFFCKNQEILVEAHYSSNDVW